MMESLKAWVINISSVVLFITAVEMILPDNSLKKYSKFVLGLILISVLINPVIKIFDKKFDINVYSNNISKAMDEYKDKALKNTINTFQANLEGIIEEKIKENFSDVNPKINVKAEFDSKENKFNIKSIDIGIKDKKVQKVKKVQVNISGKEKEDKVLKDQLSIDIKEYLSKELKVPKNIITIYKI